MLMFALNVICLIISVYGAITALPTDKWYAGRKINIFFTLLFSFYLFMDIRKLIG